MKEGGLFTRLAERKRAVAAEQLQPPQGQPLEVAKEEDGDSAISPPELGDSDMPPLESLVEESDYSGFLSPKVSEQLRRVALRKLFHGSTFNVCDGLDDYADDFTTFEKLGDVITAEMRYRQSLEEEEETPPEVTPESQPQPSDEQLLSADSTESQPFEVQNETETQIETDEESPIV